MARIGVVFQPEFAPERLKPFVGAVERAGIEELWLWEDCFRESAFATAAAALAWSARLRVGIGIAPLPFRNIAATAMEIATAQRLFDDRLIMGVGHGVLRWMDQIGNRVASPLTLMREYVPALRALLAGEEVTTQGRYVNLDRVRLDWPPANPTPILAAGEGPKTLRLTGEVADGTVFTGGTTLDQLRRGVELVAEGRAASGRAGRNEVVVYLMTVFGAADADELLRRELELWATNGQQVTGIAGDVDRVAAEVQRYAEAGADRIVLQPAGIEPDLDGFVEQAGRVAAALR